MKFSPLSLTLMVVALILLAADLAVPGHGQVLGKAEAQRFIAELMEGGVSVFASEPSESETEPTNSPSDFNPSEGATLVDWSRTHDRN